VFVALARQQDEADEVAQASTGATFLLVKPPRPQTS
jgi:hypothetical protein